MATLVCFHAHPDDEALSTGGLMAKAAAAGHRVILVTATRGEQGEPKPGVLHDGEQLWERRVTETAESAAILGAEPPRFLGYEDSGMVGEPTNDNPDCFWQADLNEAAQRLAEILDEVSADVLTIYDDHGLYGHPDHIKVHTVGLKAAELAGTPNVYESTISRDDALEGFARFEELGIEGPNREDFNDFGVPRSQVAFKVDVSAQLKTKRSAMRAHASQISESDFFLVMPEEVFGQVFAYEWFALPGVADPGGMQEVELLPGLR